MGESLLGAVQSPGCHATVIRYVAICCHELLLHWGVHWVGEIGRVLSELECQWCYPWLKLRDAATLGGTPPKRYFDLLDDNVRLSCRDDSFCLAVVFFCCESQLSLVFLYIYPPWGSGVFQAGLSVGRSPSNKASMEHRQSIRKAFHRGIKWTRTVSDP
jgi:hypothetical protein